MPPLEFEAVRTDLVPRVPELGVHAASIPDPVAVYLAQLSSSSRRAVRADLLLAP